MNILFFVQNPLKIKFKIYSIMKTLPSFLLLLIFIFISNIASAQTDIEHIFSKNSWILINKIVHAKGKTFVGGSRSDCNSATVVAFNENGALEWEVTTDGCSVVTDMFFRDSDSTLIVASTWLTACNYVEDDSGPHVFGLDIDGNYTFDLHLSEAGYGAIWGLAPYLTMTDEQIVVSNGTQLFWLDSQGSFTSLTEYSEPGFGRMLTYSGETIILASDSKITLMDVQGQVQSEVNIPNPILDIELNGDDLSILSSNEIFNFHLPTSTLSSDNDFANTIIASGMSLDENWFYVWGHDPVDSDLALIGQLDKSDFSLIQSVPLGQDSLSIKDIASDGEQLFITGLLKLDQETIFGAQLKESFVKTTSVFFEPSYVDSPDISISNFQVTLASEVVAYDSIEGIYQFANPDILFEFDLTNNGTDSIFSYSYFTQANGGIFCAEYRLFIHKNDLTLAPGETITIPSNLPAWAFHFADEIRLTVFAPNHRFDGNPSDNLLIGTDFIVSTDCCIGVNYDLQVFPTLAYDQLHVLLKTSGSSQGQEFRLVNLQGQIIFTTYISSGDTSFDISLENCSSGLYFLQYLQNGRLVETEKIMVQR